MYDGLHLKQMHRSKQGVNGWQALNGDFQVLRWLVRVGGLPSVLQSASSHASASINPLNLAKAADSNQPPKPCIEAHSNHPSHLLEPLEPPSFVLLGPAFFFLSPRLACAFSFLKPRRTPFAVCPAEAAKVSGNLTTYNAAITVCGHHRLWLQAWPQGP